MNKPRVTIVGLGFIGSSLGLALKAGDKDIQIVGHDIDPGRSKLAQKRGAVDKSSTNLIDACRSADVVVLALPLTAIRETLAAIGPHLPADCAVTDTARLKEPVLAWADEILPAGVPFIGGAPTLNPDADTLNLSISEEPEPPRADLFQNMPYALCPSINAAPTAVKRVADMVTLLQARPFFVDPTEHDGMRAAVDSLPLLVGLALMREAGGSSGWREARKVADQTFGMATAPLAQDVEAQHAQTALNAAHLLPRLDALMADLARLKAWIVEKNDEALNEAFTQATMARNQWLAQRVLGEWDEELAELDAVSPSESLGNLFGFGFGRRKS